MDLFYPTILEVAVTSSSPSIGDFVDGNVVHPLLLPDPLGKKRDTSGVFKRIGPEKADNKYMYVFHKPVPASDARNNHGLDTLVAVERELPMVVKDFKVPAKFFPDTVSW